MERLKRLSLYNARLRGNPPVNVCLCPQVSFCPGWQSPLWRRPEKPPPPGATARCLVLRRFNHFVRRIVCRLFGHHRHNMSLFCTRFLRNINYRTVRRAVTRGDIERRMAANPPARYSLIPPILVPNCLPLCRVIDTFSFGRLDIMHLVLNGLTYADAQRDRPTVFCFLKAAMASLEAFSSCFIDSSVIRAVNKANCS
jgi:hypothetical protein